MRGDDNPEQSNGRQRAQVAALCMEYPEFRERMMALCRESFGVWLNLWAWTYVVHVIEDGKRSANLGERDTPFVWWPTQEMCYQTLADARKNGRNVAIEKSRDMGATWIVLAWFVWLALFHGANLGVASRKEELVYSPGDPDALFTKIEYIIGFLPEWMKGQVDRTAMHIGFAASGGTIDGESTNSNAFRGGRKDVVFLDEAAAMPNLQAIIRSCSDVGMIVAASTHEEVSYFFDLCNSGRFEVAQLAWWNHPDKGVGRELKHSDDRGAYWTSPWYELQRRSRDPRDLALNVDMRPGGDGSLVFDLGTLLMQEQTYGCPPYHRGRLVWPTFDPDSTRDARMSDVDAAGGYFEAEAPAPDDENQWLFWFDPVPDHLGRMRPDQDHEYAIGVDVSDGVGTTPSVISVKDCDTDYKIARWMSRNTRPEQLARLLYVVGKWFGGRGGAPTMVVEANGGRAKGLLVDLKHWRYPRIYQHRDLDERNVRKETALGWASTPARKKTQLAVYGGSLYRGTFRNPDIPALRQARTYVHVRDDMGRGTRVGPKSLGHLSDSDMAEHGDIVIADMLADLGSLRSQPPAVSQAAPPYGTIAWARQQLKQSGGFGHEQPG
jgi:hypothetical protein